MSRLRKCYSHLSGGSFLRKCYSHLSGGSLLAGKASWALSGCLPIESADHCMLVNEGAWLRSRVCLLRLEVELGSALESELWHKWSWAQPWSQSFDTSGVGLSFGVRALTQVELGSVLESAQGAVHMAAARLGCKRTIVAWAGLENATLTFQGVHFCENATLTFQGVHFWQGRLLGL